MIILYRKNVGKCVGKTSMLSAIFWVMKGQWALSDQAKCSQEEFLDNDQILCKFGVDL